MADMDPTSGLWNWAAATSLPADRVHGAIAGALERSVGPFESAAEVKCDVYHVGGEFPTVIDVYLAPESIAESTAASAVAVRLGVEILLPDDSLDPSAYLLASPDGGLRDVRVDEVETDEGTRRSLRRERPAA